MTLHPFILFLLVVVFSTPIVIVGVTQLRELHSKVFGRKSSAVNFFSMSQNHPVIRDPKTLASPIANKVESDVSATLKKLYILLFSPPLENKKSKKAEKIRN